MGRLTRFARASWHDGRVYASFETDGFVVLPRAVPRPAIDAALRLLHLAIRRHGLTADEIAQCQKSTFFPHLRWEREVWDVLPEPAAEILGWQEGDDWAEPQLLLRFPDEDEPWPLEPHVDEPPPWANGRVYRGICGVALTDGTDRDGSIVIWPGSHRGGRGDETVTVPLAAGDALLMHPRLEHSGSLNLGPSLRAAVYFRLLTDAPAR